MSHKPCHMYASLIMRLVVGITLILSSLAKFKDPAGFVNIVKGMAPWMPEGLASLYGYLLPYFEIGIGALLVLGLFIKFASIVGALMFASYIIGVGIAALPNGIIFLQDPSGAWIPNKDFAYLAMMVSLYLMGSGVCSLDAKYGKKEG